MGSRFSQREFSELELSAQPGERKVQARLLKDVLEVIERRRLLRQPMRWSDVPLFAETAAVVEATTAQMEGLPADPDFGSFDELTARRDETNVVRLR
ncbi:hypothetical protein [Variovorax rhizosphaerae]|uniref:Uncharacterized protein n=1 Tax=Variovorax rhizosphaerae TaxID=1836200 RepID=A0ABU8X0V0_9BURK